WQVGLAEYRFGVHRRIIPPRPTFAGTLDLRLQTLWADDCRFGPPPWGAGNVRPWHASASSEAAASIHSSTTEPTRSWRRPSAPRRVRSRSVCSVGATWRSSPATDPDTRSHPT